jgi:hypothetical protein
MHAALTQMQGSMAGTFPITDDGIADFTSAVENDVRIARGAIAVVLSRAQIPSLLVDNLNASVHLRALLTDLFLLEQAGHSAPLPRGV